MVVGEARGAELAVLLQALNTGHQGAGFTLHANSVDTVVTRLRILLMLSGLPTAAVDELIRASVHWVIFMGRKPGVGNSGRIETVLPITELIAA